MQLPAKQSGKYYYMPDGTAANQIIEEWRKRNICFCGFVHSHIALKEKLSEADIEYAKQIYKVYHLPVLWFGVGIVHGTKVK